MSRPQTVASTSDLVVAVAVAVVEEVVVEEVLQGLILTLKITTTNGSHSYWRSLWVAVA